PPATTTTSGQPPSPAAAAGKVFRRTPNLFPVTRSIQSTTHRRHAPPPLNWRLSTTSGHPQPTPPLLLPSSPPLSINTPPPTPLTPTAAATISTTATTVSPIISTPTPRSPRHHHHLGCQHNYRSHHGSRYRQGSSRCQTPPRRPHHGSSRCHPSRLTTGRRALTPPPPQPRLNSRVSPPLKLSTPSLDGYFYS
nr:hypothetical protein [Tanacetum cinerariifolium]